MNDSRRFYIIFDQRARNDTALKEGIDKIRSLGHTVFNKRIDKPADAAGYAGEAIAKEFDTVVAVGGDGMLNLVVSGILRENRETHCAIGLIPFGTGNDFASASGIPLDNLHDAFEIVLHAKPVRIDVGQVNETFFVNVAAGGFPAEAVAEISRTAKVMLGKFAYLLTGLSNIGNLATQDVRISTPDFEWQGSIYAFGLANNRQAGGGFKISPSAVVNDGLLDLIIIPASGDGLIQLILEYSRVNHPDDAEHIIFRQVPWLKIESDETIHLNLDGEPVKGNNFHFKVHKQRLPFCLPKNSPILMSPSEMDKPEKEN